MQFPHPSSWEAKIINLGYTSSKVSNHSLRVTSINSTLQNYSKIFPTKAGTKIIECKKMLEITDNIKSNTPELKTHISLS